MENINVITDVSSLRQSWERIFITTDPFTFPFRSSIQRCVIFYPTEGYHLTEAQFKAMTAAARTIGEEGFVISVVEYAEDFFKQGDHWWCQFPSYEDYLNLPLVLENAIYSIKGNWGIVISHEDHGVVGGTEEFINQVREQYPQASSDIVDLKEAWQDNPNNDWIQNILPKVFS